MNFHVAHYGQFPIGLQPRAERFDKLQHQLETFAEKRPISKRSAVKFAEVRAAKAAIIKDDIRFALKADRRLTLRLGQFKSSRIQFVAGVGPD